MVVLLTDLIRRVAAGQQVHDDLHADARALDDGFSDQHIWVGNDSSSPVHDNPPSAEPSLCVSTAGASCAHSARVMERRDARMPLENGTRCSSTSENLQIVDEFDEMARLGKEKRSLDRFRENIVKNGKTGVAERVGFEPTVEFPLHTLSKRAPSTTRTSLHSRINDLRAIDTSIMARPLPVPRVDGLRCNPT